MKKISLYSLLLVLAFLSCRKEKNNDDLRGGQLLTRIYNNGFLYRELIYSTDKKLVRFNRYSVLQGEAKIGLYSLYNYDDDGKLLQELQFSGDNELINDQHYLYDDRNRVSRINEYSIFANDFDMSTLDFFHDFYYNEQDQLIRVTERNTNFSPRFREEYTYDGGGNLVLWETTSYVSNAAGELVQKMEIVPGERQIPPAWKKMLVRPSDFNFYQLFASSRTFSSYYGNPSGLVTIYTITSEDRDQQGYPVRQIYSSENSGSVNSQEWEYEYTQ